MQLINVKKDHFYDLPEVPDKTILFLRELSVNNNQVWFATKSHYTRELLKSRQNPIFQK